MARFMEVSVVRFAEGRFYHPPKQRIINLYDVREVFPHDYPEQVDNKDGRPEDGTPMLPGAYVLRRDGEGLLIPETPAAFVKRVEESLQANCPVCEAGEKKD